MKASSPPAASQIAGEGRGRCAPPKKSRTCHVHHRVTLERRVLQWFRRHRRALPWRTSRDPYRIWVAEIMLQQTRIAAVLPYYERFLEALPKIESVAHAPEEQVLRLWSGLGYYSRARNLRRAAQQIMERHSGHFPRKHEEALALPGIGHYTAAAVLSIAYDAPFAVVDGNVARVLARVAAIRGDLREPARWKQLTVMAQDLLPVRASGDWNQALMELGEVVCVPRAPRCDRCPIATLCQARSANLTEEIPAPRRKRAPVHMQIAAAVFCDAKNRTLLVRDSGAHDGVLFSRMWQFPAVEVKDDPAGQLRAHLSEMFQIEAELKPLRAARHGVTFRSITLLPFVARVEVLPQNPRSRILPLGDLDTLPISSATRKIAAALDCDG